MTLDSTIRNFRIVQKEGNREVSIDYDKTAKSTIRFFTSVQNKLHYAVSGNTAAEIIYNRSDHKKENMGLTSWNGAPSSKIHKMEKYQLKWQNYMLKQNLKNIE